MPHVRTIARRSIIEGNAKNVRPSNLIQDERTNENKNVRLRNEKLLIKEIENNYRRYNKKLNLRITLTKIVEQFFIEKHWIGK